ARLLLVAIGCQESAFKTRRQLKGPARGWWQFEKRGGGDEVARVPKSQPFRDAARESGFHNDMDTHYVAIGGPAGELACTTSRGILWAYPQPLPERGDEDGAYSYYTRVWRPGKPSRARWSTSYQTALEVVPATSSEELPV